MLDLAHFAVESGNDLFFDGKYGAVSGEKTIAMNRRSIVIHAPIVGAAAAVPTNVMHAVKNTVAVDHSLLAKMGNNWLLPYNIVKICKWKQGY